MRRHRERRKKSLRCITIELRESEIAALVRWGRLPAERSGDTAAVRKAVHTLLDAVFRLR